MKPQFKPLRLAKPPTAMDINRIEDEIASAVDSVSSYVSSQIAGTPGTDAATVIAPGSVSVSLANAPALTSSGTPSKWLEFTVDGVAYRVPAWTVTTPAVFPATGLWGWWNDATFPANDGTSCSSDWGDNSPAGHPLNRNGTPGVDLSGPVPAVLTPRTGQPSTDGFESDLNYVPGSEVSLFVVFSMPGSAGDTFDDVISVKDGALEIRVNNAGLTVSGRAGATFSGSSVFPDVGVSAGITTALITYSTTASSANLFVNSLGTPAQTLWSPYVADNRIVYMKQNVESAFHGPIYEAAVWDHALSATERAQLQAYVAGKY